MALNDEVQDFNERLSEVDAKIADAKSSGGDQSEELREARATMKSLRERKDAIMRDRAEIAALQKPVFEITPNRSRPGGAFSKENCESTNILAHAQ